MYIYVVMKRNCHIATKEVFSKAQVLAAAAIASWIIVRRLQKEVGRQSEEADECSEKSCESISKGATSLSAMTQETQGRKSGQSEECVEKLVTSTWPILPCSCLALLPRNWNLSERKKLLDRKGIWWLKSRSRVHSQCELSSISSNLLLSTNALVQVKTALNHYSAL